ncbi:membrane protein FxsA [Halobaculum sp. CBA1158]|uniref:FxsA family protein n=1 Tax=Halobaculum sp. CBA1158 TaxID=2904243 RepID=UPI001F216789|nr:FxsA family protein [Halobaculum sp. CBA1158]UIP01250.1 membrane protein FxsA [Halobaculum sp. CBA1158]
MRVRYLLVALLAIPLADAAFLLWVATNLLTAVQTVALVVLTGLLGMLLVRAEGRHTLRSVQRKLATGEVPTGELLDGALLIAAGAFLLTPGLVTDAIGFLLAIPPTRYPIRELLRRYVVVPYLDRKADGFVTGTVWTAGFPDGDGDPRGNGGPTAGFGGPGGPNGSGGTADSGTAGDADSADRDRDDVIDVNFEEVDDDDRGR